jgi:aryl-alcohol dehydrogenase-like predicted oxidoreductase
MSRARLALGTAQLGVDYGVANRGGRPPGDEVDRILGTALDLGIEYVDTAAAYGDAEVAIGRFLRAARPSDRLRVGTKTPRFASGLSATALARALAESIDRSRVRLGRDVIDDLLIHAAENLREYGQALVDLLVDHQAAGRVGRIGISIYDADDVRLAMAYPPLAVTQFPFSVFHRELAEQGLADDLRRAGHETFARSALQQGLLTLDPAQGEAAVRGSGTWLARFRDVCAQHDVEPLAAALAYAVSESRADFVVVGVDSSDQLRRLSRLLAIDLPAHFADEVATRLLDVPPPVRDPRLWAGRTS